MIDSRCERKRHRAERMIELEYGALSDSCVASGSGRANEPLHQSQDATYMSSEGRRECIGSRIYLSSHVTNLATSRTV